MSMIYFFLKKYKFIFNFIIFFDMIYLESGDTLKTQFIVNDYVLVWNLLFQASISETMYKLKQKIWKTYKSEYNLVYKDKNLMLEDYKNFIPNNDTIYNIVLENKDYLKLKKEAEKYRLEVMKIWDKNKKHTIDLINNILRLEMVDYKIFIVNPIFNLIEYTSNNILIVGKEIPKDNPLNLLLEMTKEIANNNIKEYRNEDEKFRQAILEFAIDNEYATNINKKNCFDYNTKSLLNLKKWLYPYWLMYLGIPKDELEKRMNRDNISFDSSKYAYEKELKKMNIEEFIDFCIRNKRYIIRESKMEKPVIIDII